MSMNFQGPGKNRWGWPRVDPKTSNSSLFNHCARSKAPEGSGPSLAGTRANYSPLRWQLEEMDYNATGGPTSKPTLDGKKLNRIQ